MISKRIIFLLIFLFFIGNCFSQELHFNNIDNTGNQDDLSFSGKNDSMNKSSFSLGFGPMFYNRYVNTLLSIHSDINLHTYEQLYIDFGLNALTDPKEFSRFGFTLEIFPNIKSYLFHNKYTFFIGAGVCTTIYDTPNYGFIFSAKFQYNINNSFSVGIQYNHSILSSDSDTKNVFMNPALYVSFKL